MLTDRSTSPTCTDERPPRLYVARTVRANDEPAWVLVAVNDDATRPAVATDPLDERAALSVVELIAAVMRPDVKIDGPDPADPVLVALRGTAPATDADLVAGEQAWRAAGSPGTTS